MLLFKNIRYDDKADVIQGDLDYEDNGVSLKSLVSFNGTTEEMKMSLDIKEGFHRRQIKKGIVTAYIYYRDGKLHDGDSIDVVWG